ncbi:PadR family transcriptional regulator [Kitasatospora sp. NBC_01560]|uniref:PadR family transcriptional regulator n=1 Tax=Kitasatospora sp. NBC_01560 TaxID=2975965 RepID=UPI00386CC00A
MTVNTQKVLKVLLGRMPDGERIPDALTCGVYGGRLTSLTGLPSGTLFPLLERLLNAGWVERYWEADESAEAAGRPRRRFYRLTARGAELVPQALAEASAGRPLYGRRPAGAPGLAGGGR